MKHTSIIFAFAVILLTSCSTAYKAGQTPDDVYYSPAKENVEIYQASNRDRYQENINYQDDRFLRMKVQNRNQWRTIDDYSYWYDSRYDYNMYNRNFYSNNLYSYNSYNSYYPGLYNFNCFNPSYYGYGGYYAPIYPVVYYKSPKVYTGVTGKSNLGTYLNSQYNNRNSIYYKGGDNAEGNFGNLMKRVFTPTADNNSNSSFDRPARTSTSTAAPSSSAGGRSGGYSSSGSSTSTSRPPRN